MRFGGRALRLMRRVVSPHARLTASTSHESSGVTSTPHDCRRGVHLLLQRGSGELTAATCRPAGYMRPGLNAVPSRMARTCQ